jgi:hypothetical protein
MSGYPHFCPSYGKTPRQSDNAWAKGCSLSHLQKYADSVIFYIIPYGFCETLVPFV